MNPNLIRFCCVFLLASVFVGCNAVGRQIVTQPNSLITPSITFSMQTETSVPTQEATLSQPQSQLLVEQFMKDNGQCVLPCVWGLTPSITRFDDVVQFFQYLGWHGTKQNGTFEIRTDMQNKSLGIDAFFYASDGHLDKMVFAFTSLNNFSENVNYYSMGNVLNTIGNPTSILVFISPPILEGPEPVDPGVHEPQETLFDILLYYQDLSLVVDTPGTAVKVGSEWVICPNTPNIGSTAVDQNSGYVAVYVGLPARDDTMEKTLSKLWGLVYRYISVERAFGLSIQDFVETAKEKNSCLKSPVSAWSD